MTVGCSGPNAPERGTTDRVVSSSTPPFSTKEPERYQATRAITVVETNGTVSKTRTSNVLIARDGLQRRDEYEAGTLGSVVYLETVAGGFVLLPKAKLYARVDELSTDGDPGQLAVEAEMMSPDYLLHESNSSPQYQKLGREMIAGRMTTKYRVTASSMAKTESFIWVDETLGMPIASQSSSTEAGISMRVSMEMSNVSTEVDPSMFALPADYRQVAASQIRDMISTGMGSVRER